MDAVFFNLMIILAIKRMDRYKQLIKDIDDVINQYKKRVYIEITIGNRLLERIESSVIRQRHTNDEIEVWNYEYIKMDYIKIASESCKMFYDEYKKVLQVMKKDYSYARQFF